METQTRTIFRNISPLDHRYSVSEAAVFDQLAAFLSEEAAVGAEIKAEIALIKAHLTIRGAWSADHGAALEKAASDLGPADVYAEEEKTSHHIRALVNALKKKLPADLAPLAHLGATSADILDTGMAYRLKAACAGVVLPQLKKLERALCDFSEREAATPQIGRTHGQHAVPVTLGFAMAEYVSRLGKAIIEIEKRSLDLRGKLAGATGSYNATALIVKDPEELEKLYLAELGLEPSEYSTQLVEPEYLLRLLLEMNTAFGIIANLADDLRHLQRSEIGEVREHFGADQVGSSTMPQKRNPWNSEHVKSLWKEFMPRAVTFFMDQISEHQRDLTNSASQRFVAEYLTGFCMAAARMTAVVEGLAADGARLEANLEAGAASGGVMAEAAYILLAEAGVSDAHEVIRRVTLKAEKDGVPFADALAAETEAFARIGSKLTELGLMDSRNESENDTTGHVTLGLVPRVSAFFQNPANYSGIAEKKARAIAAKYKKLFEE